MFKYTYMVKYLCNGFSFDSLPSHPRNRRTVLALWWTRWTALVPGTEYDSKHLIILHTYIGLQVTLTRVSVAFPVACCSYPTWLQAQLHVACFKQFWIYYVDILQRGGKFIRIKNKCNPATIFSAVSRWLPLQCRH